MVLSKASVVTGKLYSIKAIFSSSQIGKKRTQHAISEENNAIPQANLLHQFFSANSRQLNNKSVEIVTINHYSQTINTFRKCEILIFYLELY
jgi:hypothetical protein